jgi:hypothetical protein
VAVTEVASTPGARASGRRRRGGYLWMLPIGLVVLVLAVAGFVFLHRASSATGSWPQRIVVNDRDYNRAAAVPAVGVRANDSGWVQVGTAGPSSNPVYAALLPGSAPTVVVVQTSLNSYVEYVLVGGP